MSEGLIKVYLGGNPVDVLNLGAYKVLVKTIHESEGIIVGSDTAGKITPSNRWAQPSKDPLAQTKERMDQSNCYLGLVSKNTAASAFELGQELGLYKLQKKQMMVACLGSAGIFDPVPSALLKIEEGIMTEADLADRTRRYLRVVRSQVIAANQSYYRVGSVQFDLNQKLAIKEGSTIQFTPYESRLLTSLLTNLDQIVPTKQILRTIYAEIKNVTPESQIGGLRHLVNQVNIKMGDEYVESILHKGYRLADRGHIGPNDSERFREVGAFRIDRLDWLVYRGDRKVSLDPNARRAFYFLLENEGVAMDKDQIETFVLGVGNEVGNHRVAEFIYRVRKYLEDVGHPSAAIVTQKRRLYQFDPNAD